MSAIGSPSRTLKGLSFCLTELTLIKKWTAASGLRMIVRLDHSSDVEEFEEVMTFHIGKSPLCRWIMWRDTEAVFVQPIIGRIQRYGSVAEGFEALNAKQSAGLSDLWAGDLSV